jgi:hypothetical protein
LRNTFISLAVWTSPFRVAKEMKVFLKRLQKQLEATPGDFAP